MEKYFKEKTAKKLQMRSAFIKFYSTLRKLQKRNTLKTQNGCFHLLSQGCQGLIISLNTSSQISFIPLKVTISTYFLIRFKALHPTICVLFFSKNEISKFMHQDSNKNNILKRYTQSTFRFSKSIMVKKTLI